MGRGCLETPGGGLGPLVLQEGVKDLWYSGRGFRTFVTPGGGLGPLVLRERGFGPL